MVKKNMGLLKRIFRGKEEHVHFERDSGGRVTSVERSGDVDHVSVDFNGQTHTRGATPVFDKLMAQRPRKPSIREKTVKVAKRIDQGVVNYNRRQARRPMQGRPYGTGYSIHQNYNRRQARRPMQGRPYGTGYSIHQNYNPFGSMFDTGLGYSKPSVKHKTTGKKRYTVVGGKAYPIAGATKKVKKKTKKRISAGYDMFDNYGFFKAGRR
jgi:hypothetical protein